MEVTDAQRASIDTANENWKTRIVDEFNQMAEAIIVLRTFADLSGNAELIDKVEKLHLIYCDMANTVSLRVLLNGIARESICGEANSEKK